MSILEFPILICFLMITAGIIACELTVEYISKKTLVKDLQIISPEYQTSALEAFHSLRLKVCSKAQTLWMACNPCQVNTVFFNRRINIHVIK